MRKRWFLMAMILLLVPVLAVGCVSQEQYDTVAAQLSGTQQELQSVKTELGATQAKVSELTAGLDKTKSELETSQVELETSQVELETSQVELEAAQAKNAELTSSLGKTNTELEATNNEYMAFKSDLKSLWSSFGKELAAAQAIYALSGKFLTKTNPISSATNVSGKLAALNSAELTAIWEESWVRLEGGGYRSYYKPFERLITTSISRSAQKAQAIRDALK